MKQQTTKSRNNLLLVHPLHRPQLPFVFHQLSSVIGRGHVQLHSYLLPLQVGPIVRISPTFGRQFPRLMLLKMMILSPAPMNTFFSVTSLRLTLRRIALYAPRITQNRKWYNVRSTTSLLRIPQKLVQRHRIVKVLPTKRIKRLRTRRGRTPRSTLNNLFVLWTNRRSSRKK